jgi:hypothetical protein
MRLRPLLTKGLINYKADSLINIRYPEWSLLLQPKIGHKDRKYSWAPIYNQHICVYILYIIVFKMKAVCTYYSRSTEWPAAVSYIGESTCLHKEEVLLYGGSPGERVGCLLQSTTVTIYISIICERMYLPLDIDLYVG